MTCDQEMEAPEDGREESDDEFYDAEILDELTTHRGELKLRTVGFKEDRYYQVRKIFHLHILFH